MKKFNIILAIFLASVFFNNTADAQLSGTIQVGTGKTYTTLTGSSGGLFNAINTSGVSGNLKIVITSNITETGSVSLSQWTGDYTMTIQPDGTTERVISGTAVASATPMININGADRVTIDGRYNGSGKYLRFRNTNATAGLTGAAIQFNGGSVSDTLRYVYIETNVASTSRGNVMVGTTGTNNVSIQYCDIRDATAGTTGSTYIGIYSYSSSNTVTISNNNIYNWQIYGVQLGNAANGCTIQSNSFYSTITQTGSSNVVALNISGGSSGHIISGNFIGGSAPNCGGSAFVNSSSVNYTGIGLNVGSTPPTSVQGNTIQNISKTTGMGFYGIYLYSASGSANIGTTTGNTIGHATTVNSISISGSLYPVYGIYANSTNATIQNNTIANITQTNAAPGYFHGLYLSGDNNFDIAANKIYSCGYTSAAMTTYSATGISFAGANGGSQSCTIYNNMISLGHGVTNKASYIGIRNGGYSGNNLYVYYNSVYIGGTEKDSANSYACIKENSGNITQRNNNYVNIRTGGVGKHYSMGATNTSGTITSDFNNFYNSTSANLIIWGTTDCGLEAWKTISSGDAYSLSGNPVFVSTTDLKPNVNNNNCWNLNAGAIPIPTVSKDILGNTRYTDITSGGCDIGAYEFTPGGSTTAPLTISGTPSNNGTTTITFAGTTIASILWGASGTVPSNITVSYYPGIDPPNAIQNSKFANENLLISATGGSGYNYDIKLKYNLARQRTIISEENFRTAKYTNNFWNQYPITPNLNTKTITVSGLSDFSVFTFGDGESPLPVSLAIFTSSINKRNVKLKWTTYSEENNAGFEIQRSAFSGRPSEWMNAGFVSGQGTKSSPTDYGFEDRKLEAGKYNYRLKQVDRNGNFQYHELAGEVEVGVPSGFELSQNYPNPFNPATKIDFALPVDSKVTLAIYDLTGREITRLLNNEFKTANYYTANFNGGSLSNGVYFYRILTDKYTMTKKMVLVK